MDAEAIRKVIAERVDGQITAAHDAFGHHYLIVRSGRVVDSVTTKLIMEQVHLRKYAAYEALRWMENRWPLVTEDNKGDYFAAAAIAHEDNRDEAGTVGTQAHDAIERYVLDWIQDGKRPDDIKAYLKAEDDPRAYASARSAEKLLIEEGVTPVATELLVGSDKANCAGTLDMLILKDGKLELWDWKTSNQVNDKYAIQVAAYQRFFEGMTGLKISKSRIMHLSKDMDRVVSYDIPNIASAYKAFKGIAAVYDWQENGKKKLRKEVRPNRFKKQ